VTASSWPSNQTEVRVPDHLSTRRSSPRRARPGRLRRRALAAARVFVLGVFVLFTALVAAACGSDDSQRSDRGDGATSGGTVTLLTHDSFAASPAVLRSFTDTTGIEVKVLRAGDAGSMLNQAVLTKSKPVADAIFGVDNTFLGRALDAGILEPYRSPALARVPARFHLDPRDRVTPVDYGDVCVNADRRWFRQHDLPLPETLDDLAQPRYRDLLVVENPATSSPGLAFLLATVARHGTGGWLDYWKELRANGVKVVSGWEEAYSGEFSGASGHGPRPLVVSYASSPPAEVSDATTPPDDTPTVALLGTCFRQVEVAGVLKGARHPEAARKLVDFFLSERFQADVPEQMYVYPVREGTPLPESFERYAPVPPDPFTLPPSEISAHRDRWIEEWSSEMLR